MKYNSKKLIAKSRFTNFKDSLTKEEYNKTLFTLIN